MASVVFTVVVCFGVCLDAMWCFVVVSGIGSGSVGSGVVGSGVVGSGVVGSGVVGSGVVGSGVVGSGVVGSRVVGSGVKLSVVGSVDILCVVDGTELEVVSGIVAFSSNSHTHPSLVELHGKVLQSCVS